MSTPQNPARRQWLKKHRTKKLAQWREKQAAAKAAAAPADKK